MMKFPLAVAVLTLLSMSLSAQETVRPCSANELRGLERFHQNDPVELARIAAADQELEEFTQNFSGEERGGRASLRGPRWSSTSSTITARRTSAMSRCDDAMRVLNDDFNKLNPDWDNVRPEFLGIVADVDVEFQLAKKDPERQLHQGNHPHGIDPDQ